MSIRSKKHYIKTFRGASTVGAAFIARGIYAARYGHAEHPDHDILSEITRDLGSEDRTQEEAIEIVEQEVHWREALQESAIPPWALQAALDHLVESGVIDSGTNNRGQTWLAETAEFSLAAVKKWISGERRLAGASAKVVRMELEAALQGGGN